MELEKQHILLDDSSYGSMGKNNPVFGQETDSVLKDIDFDFSESHNNENSPYYLLLNSEEKKIFKRRRGLTRKAGIGMAVILILCLIFLRIFLHSSNYFTIFISFGSFILYGSIILSLISGFYYQGIKKKK